MFLIMAVIAFVWMKIKGDQILERERIEIERKKQEAEHAEHISASKKDG